LTLAPGLPGQIMRAAVSHHHQSRRSKHIEEYTMSLEGKIAIVTGAGRGLGREHALLLAQEGAKVVVNDLGGATDGTGSAATPADEVVAEIRAAGGEAVACSLFQ
jgi:glutamate dehydrogenase/leucine dehydrogenase